MHSILPNPPNPWASSYVEYLEEIRPQKLMVIEDRSRQILSRNDSPDLGFRYSANPYRGCFHGCAYCYARPTHEYLSLGAGTDFERTIVVKPEAPRLLREAFARRSWQGDLVLFSGATDCYQPLEASFGLTRRCLEVCAEVGNPVGVITKAPLIERDIDVLQALSKGQSCRVAVSIPVWDIDHARAVEPYVATPPRRMLTIERLAAAGLEVCVNVAPFIPGLSEPDLAPILRRASEAGATYAAFILLRLPGPVGGIFADRLRKKLPHLEHKILSRVRDTRQGALSDATFGRRMRGQGEYASSLRGLFEATAKRFGLLLHAPEASASRAPPRGRQLPLFS